MTQQPTLSLEFLRDKFDRAVTDQIAIADRALAVADAIANTAPEDRHFGGLLYHVQTSQADAIVLAISRLFDPAPKKYPTRSILGIIQLLRDNSDELVIHDRGEIETFLSIQRYDSDPGNLSEAELTRAFAETYEVHLKKDGFTDVNDPPAALERVRTRRDKQVAHNEDWRPAVNEIVSWQDLRQLLDEAKKFAGLVGPAYLNLHFLANDGTYMLTKSSQMVGVQMERMLRAVKEWMEQAMNG